MTLWTQNDPTLDRDVVLQWFVNTRTGARVYGRTSGFASDHIHLYSLSGVDTGCNLDPASGALKTNGGLLGDLLTVVGAAAAVAVPGLGGVVAGAVLAAGATLVNVQGHLAAVVVYPPIPGWTPPPVAG
jgi:hypothetical protein